MFAEKFFDKGESDIGYALVRTVFNNDCDAENMTALYLRMAEYHIENGETEKGVEFLVKLCTETVENYEESIELNELTEVWKKYKHLAEGKIPPSVRVNSSVEPILPEKCSMQKTGIFKLSDDELLSAMSEHLNEMSANGECLNTLNKWEKTVFYADELCNELNSGGFLHYLYYCGNHFEKAEKSFEAIQATQMLSLAQAVRNKFLRKKLPKKFEAIQNTLDKMEENGIGFEEEDNLFYESAEKELIEKLLAFIAENKSHFR